MLVGIDDTDSPAGGCTTHFALEAAAAFRREHGLVLRGRPRLVRLNPNIPWKTRGNAAVALEFGNPVKGVKSLGGVAPDGTQLWIERGAPLEPARAAHAATLDDLVARWCDLSAPGTDPAYVIADERPPERLYRDCVQRVVDPARVRHELARMAKPPITKALGDGRGIVGAAAAIAYRAGEPTFELTVYRERARWGTKRAVDFGSVETMDRAFPATFNNVDRANRHAAVAPATPCPVLFGVRATDPGVLPEAAASVRAGEAWAGWVVFETNQGTDAHVLEGRVGHLVPLETVSVAGVVASPPRRLRGGHVVFALTDNGDTIDCAAYEPTKQFRAVAAGLDSGDRVRVIGAVRDDGRTLNLEKLEVLALAPRKGPARAPACGACGARMKSSGKAGPYRCPACGAKAPRSAPPSAPAPLLLGWHEVPVCARRHLSRPIDPHVFGAPPAPKGEA